MEKTCGQLNLSAAQGTPTGELLAPAQMPTGKIRRIGRKPKAKPTQGDAFNPGKIAIGNLPQDQETLKIGG